MIASKTLRAALHGAASAQANGRARSLVPFVSGERVTVNDPSKPYHGKHGTVVDSGPYSKFDTHEKRQELMRDEQFVVVTIDRMESRFCMPARNVVRLR